MSQPTRGGGWGSGQGSGGHPDAAEKGAVTQRGLECWDHREGPLGCRQGVWGAVEWGHLQRLRAYWLSRLGDGQGQGDAVTPMGGAGRGWPVEANLGHEEGGDWKVVPLMGGWDWAGPWPSLGGEAQRWPQQEEKGLLASPASSCQH